LMNRTMLVGLLGVRICGRSVGNLWAKTSMEVRNDFACMRTGTLNAPPLYMAQNTAIRVWAADTDVFGLNLVRAQWGMPIG
jgi:hypothetical protein